MPAPPRAPTFPAFVDNVAHFGETPSSALPSNGDPLSSARPAPLSSTTTTTAAAAPADRTTSSASDVPVVPLPVSQSRSKLRAILLWRDPKLTGVIFAVFLLFFYLTLVRGMSVLSVAGALVSAYFVLGVLVVNANRSMGGKLNVYVARPPHGTPLLRRDAMYRLVDTVAEEVNDVAEDTRDILYCGNPPLTFGLATVGLLVYVIGKYVSMLVVLLVGTVALFSLPLAYERNKKQVDDTVARATDIASKHVETGRKVATERATQLRDAAAEKSAPLLEKAPPAAKNLAERMGLTPKKTQ